MIRSKAIISSMKQVGKQKIKDAECQEGRFDLETATRKNSGCTNTSETICTKKAKLIETRERPVGRKRSFVRETSDLGSGSLWS